VARIFARPLDRSRPLWEIYLIHGLPDGNVALLTKIHHAVVDGVSGNEILTVLLDPSPEGREIPPATRALGQDRVPGDIEMLGLEATTARPPRTPFNGPISPHRRFAFGRLSLDAVRELKATLGHTVNDVVVALCASAVRESLLARDALPGEPLVAMVPVSVPGPATRCSWPAPSSRPPTPCRSWSTAWASTSPS
jgi:diacylglycerol O-acyltransferase / wax synthase